MKVKDLKYYVKFIFSSYKDNVCYSTTDINMIQNIVYHDTNISINDLKIGDKITFKPNPQSYKITNIKIREITPDTDVHNYGVDSEDCTNPIGEAKEYLLSIFVEMEPV